MKTIDFLVLRVVV